MISKEGISYSDATAVGGSHGLHDGSAISYSYSYSHGYHSIGQIQMLWSVVNSNDAMKRFCEHRGDSCSCHEDRGPPRWELSYGTPVRAGGSYTW